MRRLSALAPLDDEDCRLVRAAGDLATTVAPRRDILAKGLPLPRAQILLHGWAYRSRLLPDGRRQILHVMVPGDLIAAGAHANPRALTTISAYTNVTLCPAPVPQMGQSGEGLSEAYALSRAMEEAQLFRQITRLGRLTAYERILDWVLETGERLASVGLGTASDFRMPLTQEVIADLLGLTGVHVNRVLQAIWRDGLLRVHGNMVTVLDRKRCEDVIGSFS